MKITFGNIHDFLKKESPHELAERLFGELEWGRGLKDLKNKIIAIKVSKPKKQKASPEFIALTQKVFFCDEKQPEAEALPEASPEAPALLEAPAPPEAPPTPETRGRPRGRLSDKPSERTIGRVLEPLHQQISLLANEQGVAEDEVI